jgi:hypothetical protein
MNRPLAVTLASCSLACVQTGSVGSDTGREDGIASADDDGGEVSGADDDDDGHDDSGGGDPYAVCDGIETTGGPVPGSCTPSPADSSCLQCIKLVCCSELWSCPSYEACVCMIDCAESGGPPDVCTQACGESGSACDLTGCGQLDCAQLCGE